MTKPGCACREHHTKKEIVRKISPMAYCFTAKLCFAAIMCRSVTNSFRWHAPIARSGMRIDMIEQLYQACRQELIRWCAGMTGDRSLAEDLVQEAFLRAIFHQSLLDGLSEEQQRAWLYRTVKNLYLDRKRHERYETVSEPLYAEGREAAEYAMIDWEQLLNGLPGNEGVLFVMRYLEGHTSAELGEFFGLPPGTVRSRLSDARKHLKTALKKGGSHV